MDSVTQLTLGAAIGEATLGRHVGRKAAAWGAFLGTLPDLDVITSPFVSDYTQLGLHRGFSHSVLFSVAGGAAIAYGLKKLHSRYPVPYHSWFLYTFLILLTHALLDTLTVYGTQLANPFSKHPFAWNSIFIIDPLYTVPLLLGLLISLFLSRRSRLGHGFVLAGLALSTAYLVWGQLIKVHIDNRFHASLRNQGIQYDRLMSNPTALNSVLWMGMADNQNEAFVGLYGLNDPEEASIHWMRIPKNRHLIEPAIQNGDPYVERLMWFSRGYFRAERDGQGRLFIHDLRFGRSDGYLTDRGTYIFRFQLLPDPERPDRYTGFRQFQPEVAGRGETIELLWRRIKGDTSIRGSIQESLYPD